MALRTLKRLKEGRAGLKSESSMHLNKEATGSLAHKTEHPQESRGNNPEVGSIQERWRPGKEALEGTGNRPKIILCQSWRVSLCTSQG